MEYSSDSCKDAFVVNADFNGDADTYSDTNPHTCSDNCSDINADGNSYSDNRAYVRDHSDGDSDPYINPDANTYAGAYG